MSTHQPADTFAFPGLALHDHRFELPLDHAQPTGPAIEVFAREVVAPDKCDAALPWLVFLQGGPGCESPRPLARDGWLARALRDYRVLLLDQRGTGRSSPVSAQSLAQLAPNEQANYLQHFRADSIVRDCEAIRNVLIGDERWSVLGQSFGGFCATHYLSSAPGGLREVMITGGLPPLSAHCDAVYERTYRQLARNNARYYERYPRDVERIRRIAAHLAEHEVLLPSGDRLSVRRFQQLGLQFGMSGGFETVHYLIENVFEHEGRPSMRHGFLRAFENALQFDVAPLFSILHEACYAQEFATNWSAERVGRQYPRFDVAAEGALYFTGEMIYPWMFEEFASLAPLREAAQQLAAHAAWPRLYDAAALAQNEVPCAAAIYANDMYVDRQFSEETAGQIKGLRVWLTSEYEHNGLRASGEVVLSKLLDRLHGEA